MSGYKKCYTLEKLLGVSIVQSKVQIVKVSHKSGQLTRQSRGNQHNKEPIKNLI